MKRALTLDMRDEVNGMRFGDHSIRNGKSTLSVRNESVLIQNFSSE